MGQFKLCFPLFTPHTSLKWSSRKVNAILFFIRYTLIYHFSIHEMASVVHRFLHCSFARAALHQWGIMASLCVASKHSVWKSPKKSHLTLRAKRASFKVFHFFQLFSLFEKLFWTLKLFLLNKLLNRN